MKTDPVRFIYTGSALPGNAETVVLLATAPTSGVLTSVIGGAGNHAHYFQGAQIKRVVLSLTNDQTGTLNTYQSLDRGATWNKIWTQAIGASPANSENQIDFLVEPYVDWKLEWVNNATPQTVWRVNLVGDGERVVAT